MMLLCQNVQLGTCEGDCYSLYARLVVPRTAILDFEGLSRAVRVIKQCSFEDLTTAACIVGKLRAP